MSLALSLNRGTPRHAPLAGRLDQIQMYEPGAAYDRAVRGVRACFERALGDLETSPRWQAAHVESGRTRGYRFVYLVLQPRAAREAAEEAAEEETEALVGAVTIARTDGSPHLVLNADLSGEATGTVLTDPWRCEVPLEELYEAAQRAAGQVLAWL